MNRVEQLDRVLDRGIVAILRSPSADQLVEVTRALYAGGIDVVEVTMTVPGALDVISAIRKDLGNRVLIGAGTVLDAESGRMAMHAGAEFLVSPGINLGLIQMGHRYDALVLPGAFTPTEIIQAWEAGASLVKIFPAEIGGPAFIKALQAPLPQVRMMPTGGVNLNTLKGFVLAGAAAVGIGSALVSPETLARGDYERLTELATRFVRLMHEARSERVLAL